MRTACLWLSLILLAATLMACTGRRRGSGPRRDAGPVVDAGGGTDAALPDGGDVDTGGPIDAGRDTGTPPSGPTDDLSCDGTVMDVWTISANEGDMITVRVDTVSADSAFDPAVAIIEGTTPMGTNLGSGDDEIPCTFPPPMYMCPEATAVSPTIGTIGIFVLVASPMVCSGTIGRYRVEVLVNGVPVTPILDMDDVPVPAG